MPFFTWPTTGSFASFFAAPHEKNQEDVASHTRGRQHAEQHGCCFFHCDNRHPCPQSRAACTMAITLAGARRQLASVFFSFFLKYPRNLSELFLPLVVCQNKFWSQRIGEIMRFRKFPEVSLSKQMRYAAVGHRLVIYSAKNFPRDFPRTTKGLATVSLNAPVIRSVSFQRVQSWVWLLCDVRRSLEVKTHAIPFFPSCHPLSFPDMSAPHTCSSERTRQRLHFKEYIGWVSR